MAISLENVFDTISNEYYALTAAEKQTADYIMSHRGATQFMSISELAEASGVAEATVSRFCRRLGYKGYNAFKLAVANSTAQSKNPSPLAGAVEDDDSFEDMCRKIYAADMGGEPWCQTDYTGATAFVIGNEGRGVGPLVLKKCDKTVAMPMVGEINSLNASVAAGILMYEAARQRQGIKPIK